MRRHSGYRHIGGYKPIGGFTLIEILVVMAIFSVLMGFGIGMYSGLSSLGKATQARATIIETIEAVQRSSLGSRAEMVLDPRRNLVYGLEALFVATCNFEPRTGENPITGSVTGLGFKNGTISGPHELRPYPFGHTGGALGSDAGVSVDFGNYAEYDLMEGVELDLWFYPTENRSMDLIRKGSSYGIRLKRGPGAPVVAGFLAFGSTGEGENLVPSGKQVFEVSRPLVMNRWNRIVMKYDRNVVTISVDSHGWGAVERFRQKENRPILPDREATLTVGSERNPLIGRVDDMKVAGIHASDSRPLPDQVAILGEARKIRYLDGKLDPREHRGEVTITLLYRGVEDPITIGLLGNILEKR